MYLVCDAIDRFLSLMLPVEPMILPFLLIVSVVFSVQVQSLQSFFDRYRDVEISLFIVMDEFVARIFQVVCLESVIPKF